MKLTGRDAEQRNASVGSQDAADGSLEAVGGKVVQTYNHVNNAWLTDWLRY